MKTIGLLGGMSWESTVTYYQLINEAVKEQLGGLHSAKIVLHSVDFDEIEKCQSSGNWARSGEILGQAAAGLEREVRELLSSGLSPRCTAMQAIGYKEFLGVLDGTATVEEAVAEVKLRSRQYAKRQLTWFKRERDVTWLNLPDYNNDRTKVLEKILSDVKNKFEMEF